MTRVYRGISCFLGIFYSLIVSASGVEESELEAVYGQLREQRSAFAAVSDPLSKEIASLEAELALLEAELAGKRARIAEEREAIQGIRRNFRDFQDLEEVLEVSNLDELDGALSDLETRVGGLRVEGQAILPDGAVSDGTFLEVGPLGFFVGKDGEVGFVDFAENRDAVVRLIPDAFRDGLVALVEKSEGVLPVDVSLGEAIQVYDLREGIGEHLRKGGVVLYPLGLLAVLSLLIALFKWYEISRFRPLREGALQEFLRVLGSGSREEACRSLLMEGGPLPGMIVAISGFAGEGRQRIEEAIDAYILDVRPKLERYLSILSVTAVAAPLLGLLGTVMGMMKTFNFITVFGTSQAGHLSTGISEALITTEVGLCVAIPALVVHSVLLRKVEVVNASLEETGLSFLNGLNGLKV